MAAGMDRVKTPAPGVDDNLADRRQHSSGRARPAGQTIATWLTGPAAKSMACSQKENAVGYFSAVSLSEPNRPSEPARRWPSSSNSARVSKARLPGHFRKGWRYPANPWGAPAVLPDPRRYRKIRRQDRKNALSSSLPKRLAQSNQRGSPSAWYSASSPRIKAA